MKKVSTRFLWFRWLALFALLITVGLVICWVYQTGDRTSKKLTTPPDTFVLSIPQEGFYEVPLGKLEELYGGKINSHSLRLIHRGEQVPLWLIPSDNRLYFWGQPTDSVYTAENIYLLTINSEQTTVQTSPVNKKSIQTPNASDVQRVYLHRIELQQNLVFSPMAPPIDSWLWQTLAAPGELNDIEFVVDDIADGQGRVTVKVWSNTQSSVSPDHQAILRVNDIQICEDTWDGEGAHPIVCKFSSDVLYSGSNSLTIQLPGIDQVPAEVIYTNKIQIEVPRPLTIDDTSVIFTAEASSVIFGKLTQPVDLFDITNSYQPVWIATVTDYTTPFRTEVGHRYLARLVDSEALSPSTIRAVESQTAPETDPGADMLIFGADEMLDGAKRLADYRTQQGLSVRLLSLDDVYLEYGFGFPEPDAIRTYIAQSQTWKIKPRYVLLLGDASYDPRNYVTEPIRNTLPTFFIKTEYGGYTASDIPFVDVDSNGSPDVAIGRLPAQTPEQLTIITDKILAYENDLVTSDWRKKVLLIADGQDRSFLADANKFRESISEAYQVELFAPEPGSQEAQQVITVQINSGQGIVAYFGHGSIGMWGKDQLFTVDDVAGLNNRTQPSIFINMTCLTGLFTHPKIESLSEALLWRRGGGAVAVLAPTSLTLAADQSQLSSALADKLFDQNAIRMGDALLYAWRNIPIEGGTGGNDVLNTFLLFGDPAMIVR